MANIKYKTKQKEEILSIFESRPDECFTARDICRLVCAGEATVFRTLASLVETGKLTRFSGDSSGKSASYRYNSCTREDGHVHLICDKCGNLIHADCDFFMGMVRHFGAEHGFAVNCGKTVIYGTCSSCANAEG